MSRLPAGRSATRSGRVNDPPPDHEEEGRPPGDRPVESVAGRQRRPPDVIPADADHRRIWRQPTCLRGRRLEHLLERRQPTEVEPALAGHVEKEVAGSIHEAGKECRAAEVDFDDVRGRGRQCRPLCGRPRRAGGRLLRVLKTGAAHEAGYGLVAADGEAPGPVVVVVPGAPGDRARLDAAAWWLDCARTGAGAAMRAAGAGERTRPASVNAGHLSRATDHMLGRPIPGRRDGLRGSVFN